MASTVLTAATAAAFLSSLGVNTHIDFKAYGYQNLAITEQAIRYLGVKNLRDSGQIKEDVQLWSRVSLATGAKFLNYMPMGSPASVVNTLAIAPLLAEAGILNGIEGGNEEDAPYAVAHGNSLAWAAAYQPYVFQVGRAYGLPVVNMSFGAGWTAANDWQGNYGTVGDLSAYADYANAHTYPNVGQTTDVIIQRLNGLAKKAAVSRPVMTTEIGWDTLLGHTDNQVAKYVVQAAFDGWKNGNPKTYFYALFDDGSGNFGLMNTNGTAKPAGHALHNLTTLLADTSTPFAPEQAPYTMTGGKGTENTLLFQKSDGSFWYAVWDEVSAPHNVTFSVGTAVTKIDVYDPVTSTNPIQTVSNTDRVTLNLNGNPLLVKVVGLSYTSVATDLDFSIPGAQMVAVGNTLPINGVVISDPWATSNPGSMVLKLASKNGAALSINGQNVVGDVVGSLSQLNSALGTLTYKGAVAGVDTVTINVWNQAGVQVTKQLVVSVSAAGASSPSGLSINVPGTQVIAVGTTQPIGNVSIADAWAASNPGSMALSLTSGSGATLSVNGRAVSGTITGSLAQLNAALATLTYRGTVGGTDRISVNVWNQAGVQATKQIAVSAVASAPVTGGTSPDNLSITVPQAQTVATGASRLISGVLINDLWAASKPGLMALNLTAGGGATLSVNGRAVSGTITGSLAQLNAALATLVYRRTVAGTDSIRINVWNQAGVQSTKLLAVSVTP